jgi:hypothetical protein
MAWHYLGVLQAVLNFSQAGADPPMLDRMIDVAMSAWPATGAHSRDPLTPRASKALKLSSR